MTPTANALLAAIKASPNLCIDAGQALKSCGVTPHTLQTTVDRYPLVFKRVRFAPNPLDHFTLVNPQ